MSSKPVSYTTRLRVAIAATGLPDFAAKPKIYNSLLKSGHRRLKIYSKAAIWMDKDAHKQLVSAVKAEFGTNFVSENRVEYRYAGRPVGLGFPTFLIKI